MSDRAAANGPLGSTMLLQSELDRSEPVLFQNVRTTSCTTAQPLCCLAVDAEEDFDWNRPVRATGFSTECMHRIADLQGIVAAYGLRPTYLMTFPVLEDADAVRMIRCQYERGECDLGIQLHTWVTPPFEEPSTGASYLGSLDAVIEERKLVMLIRRFREIFGFAPVSFRAGRYGLSGSTARLLEKHGFTIDTSLAPRTNSRGDGGPDFSGYECDPFWFGETRALLELPLCRSLIGWSGPLAPLLYRATASPSGRWRMGGVLSRLRIAERVTLSPEGNDVAAMRRFLTQRRRMGQTVFSLSFHSSSMMPGRNPYVRTRADLHYFYDRLSEILDVMSGQGFRFAALGDIPTLLGDPAPVHP